MTDANAPLDAVLSHVDANIEESLERLFTLLRIASISTDPAYAGECLKAAEWLTDQLNGLDFEATVRPTPGHPMVWLPINATRPGPMFFSTAIMMSSRSIRSNCGPARRSNPKSAKRMAAR